METLNKRLERLKANRNAFKTWNNKETRKANKLAREFGYAKGSKQFIKEDSEQDHTNK